MRIVCTVFACDWFFTGTDPAVLKLEERRHWDEYHAPNERLDDNPYQEEDE